MPTTLDIGSATNGVRRARLRRARYAEMVRLLEANVDFLNAIYVPGSTGTTSAYFPDAAVPGTDVTSISPDGASGWPAVSDFAFWSKPFSTLQRGGHFYFSFDDAKELGPETWTYTQGTGGSNTLGGKVFKLRDSDLHLVRMDSTGGHTPGDPPTQSDVDATDDFPNPSWRLHADLFKAMLLVKCLVRVIAYRSHEADFDPAADPFASTAFYPGQRPQSLDLHFLRHYAV